MLIAITLLATKVLCHTILKSISAVFNSSLLHLPDHCDIAQKLHFNSFCANVYLFKCLEKNGNIGKIGFTNFHLPAFSEKIVFKIMKNLWTSKAARFHILFENIKDGKKNFCETKEQKLINFLSDEVSSNMTLKLL